MKRSLTWFTLLGLITGACIQARAMEFRKAPENLLKAAYLYKFIFFTTWPESAPANENGGTEFIIGILGQNDFGNSFRQIEGRDVSPMNRRIAVRAFGAYRDGLDLGQCHILFIDASETAVLQTILHAVNSAPVLTVSDSEGFCEQGVMLNLVTLDDHLRWELNLSAIRNSGLQVSSTLIQSAVKVLSEP